MNPGFESLTDIVRKTWQSKSALTIRIKPRAAASLNEELGELEKTVAECLGRLKTAVKAGESAVVSESEHSERVIDGLRANISGLEAKLRQTQDAVRRNESASQRLEASLNSNIADLQRDGKSKDETLERQSAEIKSQNAKIEHLSNQVIMLEQSVKKKDAKAASDAQRIEQLSEGSKIRIATLEAQVKDLEEICRAKEASIHYLDQDLSAKVKELELQESSHETLVAERDKQIGELKSEVAVLTKSIKEMLSAFKQAEARAGIQSQDDSAEAKSPDEAAATAPTTSKPLPVVEKPAAAKAAVSLAPAPQFTNKATEPVRGAVTREFFDSMTKDLNELLGPMATVVIHDHVASLKESMEKFPQARAAELVDLLVREIPDEKQKSKFRERLSHLLVAGNPSSQSLKTVAR